MKVTKRVKRFCIAGSSAALVNLSLMILFVEGFGFATYYLKNLANLLSIEISILYHFFISRWTWSDAPSKKGKYLIGQCALFHAANITAMAVRIILFAILETLGVYYIVNVIASIRMELY